MSALTDAAADYLQLRRSLGHDLADAHRLLPRFVAYLERTGTPRVTVAAAMSWATEPDVDPDSTVWPRRLTVARGFARYMTGIDPDTEIPPPGLIPARARWTAPYIFSPADITALMAQARTMHHQLRAGTYETLIGLLAATGLRVGEALRLDCSDVDLAGGVLLIRQSKFDKTRQVPVSASTRVALHSYADLRDRLCTDPPTASFFVSMRGTRVIYQCVQDTFRRLCDTAGIGQGAGPRPHLHGLRHTFTVQVLLGWYRSGQDVEASLPMLSAYLGHRDPRSTYWYLSAAPELLALAAGRLHLSREVITR